MCINADSVQKLSWEGVYIRAHLLVLSCLESLCCVDLLQFGGQILLNSGPKTTGKIYNSFKIITFV